MEKEPVGDDNRQDQVKGLERAMFNGVVRVLRQADLAQIKAILEVWLKNNETGQSLPEEVDTDLAVMEESIQGKNDREYIVAEEDNRVSGVVGLKTPDERLMQYTVANNPAEAVNLYLDPEQRGRGVGKALMYALEKRIIEKGHNEIILCSGPRYKDTAWGFYDHLPEYSRVAVAKDYFGQGRDGPVWRKELINQ